MDEKSKEMFLTQHVVINTTVNGKNTRTWQCTICKREFKYQYTLMRHMPIHTNVRNFHCNLCPKSFRQLSTLAQHKATHTNIRPYSCDQCQKSFNRVSTLISHKKIHQQTKRYICHICGKGFHQKGNLRNHIYTHTNERPYKCEICQKGFNQKSNLVCHKSSAHGEKKVFKCQLCPGSFSRENTYLTHMKVNHLTKAINQEEPTTAFRHPRRPLTSRTNHLNIPATLIGEKDVTTEGKFKVISQPNISNKCEEMEVREVDENVVLDQSWSLIIKREPTPLMERIRTSGRVVFVLLSGPDNNQPFICKAALGVDGFILTMLSADDYSSISIKDSFKIPVALTIMRTYDGDYNEKYEFIEHRDIKEMIIDKKEGLKMKFLTNGSPQNLKKSNCSSIGIPLINPTETNDRSSNGFLVVPTDEKGEVLTASQFFNSTDCHLNVYPSPNITPPEIKKEDNENELSLLYQENSNLSSSQGMFHNEHFPGLSRMTELDESGMQYNFSLMKPEKVDTFSNEANFMTDVPQLSPPKFDMIPHWLKKDICSMEENNNISSSPQGEFTGNNYVHEFSDYFDSLDENQQKMFDTCDEGLLMDSDLTFVDRITNNSLLSDIKVEEIAHSSYQYHMPNLDEI